jgi:hypothetical protein
MARNIVVKAGIADVDAVRARAGSLATSPAQVIDPTNTFVVVPRGCFKVREFEDGSGEMISYESANESRPPIGPMDKC